ncbi:hypothetical protein CAP31_06195 [Sulfuriferula sp. AH1]|nr:hypothetical protein CAP31_06195 [Sulfuriferula sp. AH1]
MISAIFHDLSKAEQAYRSVFERGYSFNDINVAMSEATQKRYYSGQPGISQSACRAAIDRDAGDAAPDAIEYALAAVGTPLVLSRFRLVVAGTYSAINAEAGGLARSLADTLFRWRIPEQHIKQYERGLMAGGIMISVKPRNHQDAAHIANSWQTHSGECILA